MSSGRRFSLWRFLKRVLMHNIGLKALALVLACYIYFSLRPEPAADGAPPPPSPQPFKILAPAPTVLYVTNTVVTNVVSAPAVYTNYIPRVDFAPLPAPVEPQPEMADGRDGTAEPGAAAAPEAQNAPAAAGTPPEKTEPEKPETEKTADA